MTGHSDEIAQLVASLRSHHEDLRQGEYDAENDAEWTRCRQAADLIEKQGAESERLRAVVQAEIDMHFKRQDQDSGGTLAGSAYCDVDDFVWPCPIRRRLEAVLSGR